MRYVKLAKLDDFAESWHRTYSIMGKKLTIMKRDDGTFFAREMTCKHQGADLSQEIGQGMMVTCPRHGWTYDLETGECQNHDSPKLREHDVLIEGDVIKVCLTPAE